MKFGSTTIIVVSIVFLVRLASGDGTCNESIVLHYTIVCGVFITQRYAMKIRRKFLVYEKKYQLTLKAVKIYL